MAAVRVQTPISFHCCRLFHSLPWRPSLLIATFQTRRHLSLSTGTVGARPWAAMKASAMAKRRFSPREDEVASAEDLCFEAPLKIVEYPDPILRRRNKRISTFDENLKKLVDEMFHVMYKTDGIGLSAPQVGKNVRLMVFNPAGVRGEGEETVLVNPKIYKSSKKMILFDEGCLSFPRIYGDIERPASVKVEAQDSTGSRFTISLSGLPARVFQHEFDHLQGTLFFERMAEDVLDNVRPALKVLEQKYENQTGLPSPESIDNYKKKKIAVGFVKA